METERRLLVHFLATIAYRTQKALRNTPDGFSDFRTAAGVRTPHQLVRHMSDVLGFADRLVSGGPPGRAYAQPTLDGEVARFHRVLTELRATVAAASADTLPAERLLQGPLADAISHVGQLAMLRRLAGAPIPPENFLEAEVSSDNVGADQSEARSPDAEWFAAEDEPYGVTDNPDATSEGGMNRYRHTQIGWVMLATAIVPLTIVVGVLGRAGEPLLLLLPLAILIPVLAVFGWLTVTIDDRELNARFGVSPVRKRIALASIASFEPVRNRWYYGFGVRYTPGRGWLYNVSGLDAVEIVLHDGTNIRIGTDEPDAVVHVLSQAVSERRRESTSASGIGAGLPVPVVVVGVILIPVAFVAVLLFLLRS